MNVRKAQESGPWLKASIRDNEPFDGSGSIALDSL
jgi:hypothetical protein